MCCVNKNFVSSVTGWFIYKNESEKVLILFREIEFCGVTFGENFM